MVNITAFVPIQGIEDYYVRRTEIVDCSTTDERTTYFGAIDPNDVLAAETSLATLEGLAKWVIMKEVKSPITNATSTSYFLPQDSEGRASSLPNFVWDDRETIDYI